MKFIEFGSLVKDRVTGFEGTVTARVEHMNNCVRYAVQPPLGKKGELGKIQYLDGPNLDIIAPPKADLPPAVKTPNAFKLGVKVKDLVTGFEGTAVMRIKHRHSGDRYGIQPPVKSKGRVPPIESFDEEDLVQIDPPPPKRAKKKKESPPNGPHDSRVAMAR